jgi:phosphatidylinositol-4,5-bisphosphate 3-kinase
MALSSATPLSLTLSLLCCATGIPELKTHKDVAYLKETLFLDRSEEEAMKAFEEEVRTWELLSRD